MQRRSFLSRATLGTAGASLAALAAPVVAQDAPTLEWRLASGFPRATDAIFSGSPRVARYVSEASDGKFNLRLLPPDEAPAASQLLDALQAGEIECGHMSASDYSDKDPALCFAAAVPFGLNSRQMNAWMRAGDGLALTRKVFEKYGIIHFPCGCTGAQMGGWFRAEIKSADDLKGLKFRTTGLAGAVLARLGVQVAHMPGDAVRTALESGRLDAAQSIGPLDDEMLGLHLAARNYYFPGWWAGTSQVSLCVNRQAYDSLPARYQAILAQACEATGNDMLARYDAENPAALRRLVTLGAQLKAFPKAVLDTCHAEAQALYAGLGKADPLFAQLHDSMLALREASTPWLRLAEGSYDGYVGTLAMRP